jgi:outer membrane lipoprotein SlyB
MLSDGSLDDGDEFLERNVGGYGGELDGGIVGHGIGRRKGRRGNGDLDPAPVRIGVVTEGGYIAGTADADVDEPIAGFGVDMNFGMRNIADDIAKHAENQMAIGCDPIVVSELGIGEVPVCVKPMRIAGDQQQPFGAVGGGEIAGDAGSKPGGGWFWSEGVADAWPAALRFNRAVAFEQ